MHTAHIVSCALFILTALLLITAEFFRANAIGRIAAMLAIVTVVGADAFLLARVPEMGGFAQPSGNKSAKKQAKQQGEAEADEDVADAAERSGSGSGGSNGDAAGIVSDAREAVASLFKAAPGRGEPVSHLRSDCPDCPEVVVLPPGSAVDAAWPSEQAHANGRVVMWPGFAIGRDEVSHAQFDRFVKATGYVAKSCATGAGHGATPARVACIGWNDAVAYVTWLSRHTGHRYRLPTATEWLYAAEFAHKFEDGPRGMATDAAEAGTAVAELVSDCWQGSLVNVAMEEQPACHARTVVDVPAAANRSGSAVLARVPMMPGVTSPAVGFRVVRVLD